MRELPKRSDSIYQKIENLEDYEYTNCIAYEMAIRNEVVRKKMHLLNTIKTLKNNIINKRSNRNKKGSKYQFKIYPIIESDYVEKIIKDFLKKNYYIDYDYRYNESDEKAHDYGFVTRRRKKDYYNDFFGDAMLSYLHKNHISSKYNIKYQDEYFIEQKYNRKTQEFNSFITPNFRNKLEINRLNSKDIFINLNLFLPKDELLSYISKIKDDFDSNNSIIKSPLELIGEELDKAEEIKSKALPKDKDKKRKAMAEAFYIYDIWKILDNDYAKKTEDLKFKQIKRIEYIKKNMNYDKYDRKSKIDEIIIKYKDELVNYTKVSLRAEIANQLNISIDTVDKLHALMIKYIDKLKYKELITGVSN